MIPKLTKELLKETTRADQRLVFANMEGEMSVYDWDIQTGTFIVKDPRKVMGTPVGSHALTRVCWESLIHSDDRESVAKAVQSCLEGKTQSIQTEYRILSAPGKYIWLQDHATIVRRDNKGVPCRLSGFVIDISSQKRVLELLEAQNAAISESLRRSEEEKSAILLGLKGLADIRYLNPQLQILWKNNDISWEENVGDCMGPMEHCYTITHGRTNRCDDCPAIDTFITGKLQERENTLSNGQSFIRRSSPVRDAQGVVSGVIHIALNITKHKQTEEGLKATNAFLHSLLTNSPTPICVSDSDGRIDTVNEAWEKTLGFSREETVGRFFRDILAQEVSGRISKVNNKVLTSDSPVELEELIDCPTGLHHFHIVTFPLQDATGRTAAVGTIFVDVTARKRAEEELTKREVDLRRKSRQLGEMNTTLRVLLKQREADQKELEERIVANVKELVLPYINKLKKMHLNEDQTSYLEIVEAHMNDIIAPFLRQMVSQHPHMTAKELQVAVLVREGRSNKEIADLMKVSHNTIEIHRYNLRRKLDIQNKKINLRSYLLSLNKLD